MKKIISFFIVTICIFLIGCQGDKASKDGNATNDKTEIVHITVTSAEENPENIWEIYWPDYYFAGSEIIHFDENHPELTKEETEYIISYAKSIPELPKDYDMSECICNISVWVKEENVQRSYGGYIFGDYPEGSDEFCKIINRICGDDKEYLCMNGKMQEMTDEYFTILTGYTDDDIKGGTIREVIEHLGIDNVIECYPYFLKNWYYTHILDNYELCRLLPYEVCSVESSDSECKEYAKQLADKLGSNSGIKKGSSEFAEQEWYEFDYNGKTVRVYRTELVSKDIENSGRVLDSYTQCYKIYEREDYGELVGGRVWDFVYSNDKKFAAASEFDYKDEYKTLYEIGIAAKDIETKDTEKEQNEFVSAFEVGSSEYLFEQFLMGEIDAEILYPTEEDEKAINVSQLNMNPEEWSFDSFSVGEQLDLDNDGEDELILDGPYGGMYLDAIDGKLYVFAKALGNAGALDYTFYDGAYWIVIKDTTHGGRLYYLLYKYEGGDNLVESMSLLGNWYSEDDTEFTFNDEPITEEEFNRIHDELFASKAPIS